MWTASEPIAWAGNNDTVPLGDLAAVAAGAVVAAGDDVGSVAYNPAGLAGIDRNTVSVGSGLLRVQVSHVPGYVVTQISHGPRGDIVSVYTTFPWPVLCAEVAKLKIEPAGVRIPRGLADKTRCTAVTGEQSSRNRWTKSATPAGHYPI